MNAHTQSCAICHGRTTYVEHDSVQIERPDLVARADVRIGAGALVWTVSNVSRGLGFSNPMLGKLIYVYLVCSGRSTTIRRDFDRLRVISDEPATPSRTNDVCPACGHRMAWVDGYGWICSKRGGCGNEYEVQE